MKFRDSLLSVGLVLGVLMFMVGPVFAELNVNDRVVCRWKNGSTWYPGVIVEKTGRQIFIHYDDGDKEHTTVDKCMKRDDGSSLNYEVGELVKIKWKGSWWDGSIIAVNKNKKTYKIHYDGYNNSWDEWVGPDRLQKKR